MRVGYVVGGTDCAVWYPEGEGSREIWVDFSSSRSDSVFEAGGAVAWRFGDLRHGGQRQMESPRHRMRTVMLPQRLIPNERKESELLISKHN